MRTLDRVIHQLISIHALRKESDLSKSRHAALTLISIHALRKESDRLMWKCFRHPTYFNPRSP